MKTFLPFIITGLATGSLYSIAALGLVLTYKTTGIFNFAHGAVAAASAYIFYDLNATKGLPWPLAVFLCVFVVAPIAGILLERVARGLADVPPGAKIVATVGLLLVVQGLIAIGYSEVPTAVPQFLPTRGYKIFDVIVGADQLIAVAIAAVAAALLYALLRFTRTGVAMRGVVDNPALLDLAGTNPARIRTLSWMIGSAFAALSGILLMPYLGLFAVLLTLMIVQAFGAAAVGGFSSLPLTYVGGLIIGVGAALSTKYAADYPALSGFPASFPFIVLFIFLLVSPKTRLAEAGARKRLVAADHRALPPKVVWAGRAGMVVAAILAPQFVSTRLPLYTNALIFVLVFVSLRLLVRTSGQVSLCHAAFAAVGSAAFSHLAGDMPWALALVLAGLITVPIGAVVAIPAIRLSGLYLALATFGFGILLERMAFNTSIMFGALGGHRQAPRPGGSILASDEAFYYVCLAVVLASCVLVYRLNRSRLGRLLRALADSPLAMSTHGTSVNVTRVLVLCVSAFLAGVAGALFASLTGTASGSSFTAFHSLTWLTVVMATGAAEFGSPVFGALLLVVLPSYGNQTVSDWLPVVLGGIAVVSVLAQGGRFPLATWCQRATERHSDRRRYSPVAERWALARHGSGTLPEPATQANATPLGTMR